MSRSRDGALEYKGEEDDEGGDISEGGKEEQQHAPGAHA